MESRKAHLFNIDTIIKIKQMVWIIDKTKPSIPIIKVNTYDLNIYKSGIFHSHGNEITFNGVKYWLPNDIMSTLKVKVKNLDTKLSNIGISMQEFLNKELIENLEFSILEDNFEHLKDSPDDIYIICSKRDRIKYEKFIDKVREKLSEYGVKIKAFYHINETFYNQSSDNISYNKVKIVVQHLTGFKTNDNQFIDEEITSYDEIYLYDDSEKVIATGKAINDVLRTIYKKTKDEGVRLKIVDNMNAAKKIAKIVAITNNKLKKHISSKVEVLLESSKLIKSFESFIINIKK